MVENAVDAPASAIVDRLTGKTVLLTGVTGFLGQVIFERLLGDVPEGRIVLLVRSQTGSTSRARVEYLFRKPAFDVVRGRIGEDGLRALLDERVTIVDGDFRELCRSFPTTSTSRSIPPRRSHSIRRSTRGSRLTCSAP